MTTARSLIQQAFREGNITPIGRSPTDAELSEGLVRLNRFIDGVYGHELGENLVDWPAPRPQRTAPVAANYPQLPYPSSTDMAVMSQPLATDLSLNISPFPPKNSRIVWGRRTMTIYLPEQPDPGSRIAFVEGTGLGDDGAEGAELTIDANGRTIEGAPTLVLTSPAKPRQWLYREDTGDWRPVVALALDDECPFPEEFDDFWVVALAMRLAPRYGKTTAPETQLVAQRMLTKLKARYRQSQDTVYKSYDAPWTGQSYIPSGTWFW